jgi:hypothetical protein
MKPVEAGDRRPRAFVTPRVTTFRSSQLLDLIGPALGQETDEREENEGR